MIRKATIVSLGMLIILALYSCNSTQEPFSFVQLCDPQLGMSIYDKDTSSLSHAIRQINEMDVDFAVICGDLVHHASDSTFADLLHLLDAFKIPYYLVPGNHDVGMTPTDSTLLYYRNTIGEDYYQFNHKGLSMVFTNSQLWKSDVGEESQKHDTWFRETLAKRKKNERVVVVGHIPFFINDIQENEVYSNFPSEHRTNLLDLCAENNVVAYLSGHKHELIVHDYQGIQLVTGESTAKNFDKRPFGFRRWDVTNDTLIHSFIKLNL